MRHILRMLHHLRKRLARFTTTQHICLTAHIGNMQRQTTFMVVEAHHGDLFQIDDQMAITIVVVTQVNKVHGV